MKKWNYSFKYRGRSHTLYKRFDSPEANYYLEFEHRKERVRQSLETHKIRPAVEEARLIIDEVIDKKRQARSKAPATPTLAHIEKVYLEDKGVMRRTALNNVLMLKRIFERVRGAKPDFKKLSVSDLTDSLCATFQEIMKQQYCAKAESTPQAQREAKDVALRSSKSMVKQARSIFSRNMLKKYRALGLTMPDSLTAFLKCELLGKAVKANYMAPSDETVEKALSDIAQERLPNPNVFLAFWLSIGAGLRKGEIGRADWSHIIDIENRTWYVGGIGKDGLVIRVCLQSRALEALRPFRKPSGRILDRHIDRVAKQLNKWLKDHGWNTRKKMHELRAYVGSKMYKTSPADARAFMRHKTISTTEQFYLHYGHSTGAVDVL